MNELPLYVYGILPAAASVAAHDGGTGVSGGMVKRLDCDDLAVLVSSASATPVTRTRRNLLTHTAVLERALQHATVLPLRFGTVAPDAVSLCTCISANRAAFRAALREIDGQIELGVKAVWRRGLVYNEVVERDQALRQLRDRLRSRAASETYYERIELGRRVEAAVAELRTSESTAILAELLPLAEREAELHLADEDMVLSRAFLVRRDAESAFDAALARLADRFADRMEFRYVGPVPPFNFVSLKADWLTTPAVAVRA
jgi:hypothetical protein